MSFTPDNNNQNGNDNRNNNPALEQIKNVTNKGIEGFKNNIAGNVSSSNFPTKEDIKNVTKQGVKGIKDTITTIANNENVTEAREHFKDTLNNLLEMVSNNKQNLSSIILTLMDALNFSIVGGLQGLKVELENIVIDEKANSGGEPNAGIEFIGECASFISFFLQYIIINKDLKYKKESKTIDNVVEIENEKNIEYLNNAFKHLAYTYGQLSGRTIYYISKILQSGDVGKVGLFDPISFGSMTGSLVKMSPVGGVLTSVIDTIKDFFSALAEAGKSSFKSLEDERKLAGEYMEYINTELGKSEQAGGRARKEPEENVNTAILNKLHHPKSNKKYDEVGNFEARIEMLIKGKKTKHSAHSIHLLTGADIQRQINEIEVAMDHYNHVSSLVKLLNDLTSSHISKNIYIGDGNSNDALEKLIDAETSALHSNAIVKEEFVRMLQTFNEFDIKQNNEDTTIKNSNIQLYNIVKDFIVNNYELYGNKLGELSDHIGFDPKDDKDNKDNKDDKDNNIEAYIEDKNEKFFETLNTLEKIVKDEIERINEENRKQNASSKPTTPYDYLKGEHNKLKTKLTKLNSSKFDDVKSKVSASGNYKKYSSFLKQFKRDMKKEITSLKTTHMMSDSDAGSEAGSEAAQESTDLINSGLKKILTFIRIKDFGAINNMANKFDDKAIIKIKKLKDRKKKYSDALNSGGGGGRSSIRRRINSATRRIQTTLDSFNSTTRRNVRAKSKPRETRRQHYGH
jgi:hypothetical protein